MSDRVVTNEPLGPLFVPDGVYYAVRSHNHTYGPFFNEFVARQWSVDSGVNGRVDRMEMPMLTKPAPPTSKGNDHDQPAPRTPTFFEQLAEVRGVLDEANKVE